MRIVTVESTTLATVAYDEARELLLLEFCSRKIYQYFGVPAALHQELLGAPSKGRYFNQAIRGRFQYRLILHFYSAPADAEVAAGCDH